MPIRSSNSVCSILALAYAAFLIITRSPAGGRFGGGLFPAGSPLWWLLIALLIGTGLLCGYRALRPTSPMD